MEKIKAALHIHDKTEVPGDGAVGNMQNPSASETGPTATELWEAGNDSSRRRHNHNSDTVAAAAAESSKQENYSQSTQLPPRADDPFTAAHQAQQQMPPSSYAQGDENAIVAAELSQGQALPQQEKTLSPIDDEKLVNSIDPFRKEPEPSSETGPGTHFTRPDMLPSTAANTNSPPALAGHGEAQLIAEGHTTFYDKATGREGHELGK